MAWDPTNWQPPNWQPPNWPPPATSGGGTDSPAPGGPITVDRCNFGTFKDALASGTLQASRYNDRHGNYAKDECTVTEVWVTIDGQVWVLPVAFYNRLPYADRSTIKTAGASVTIDGAPY